MKEMRDGMTLAQWEVVRHLEQRAMQMGPMSADDYQKLTLILYDFRVMAWRLDECRNVMDANDPGNAAELFGTPEERAGG